MAKNELTNILKEIWDEKDFITGVQLCLSKVGPPRTKKQAIL